jgi:hypothetical protein
MIQRVLNIIFLQLELIIDKKKASSTATIYISFNPWAKTLMQYKHNHLEDTLKISRGQRSEWRTVRFMLAYRFSNL